MAALGAFGGGSRPWDSPRPSHQQDFLDHMRHVNREAWHRFMDRYRGMDFRQFSMNELEGRFYDEAKHLREELTYGVDHAAMAVPSTPPRKKTWFEEIQAEVDEWLTGVDK